MKIHLKELIRIKEDLEKILSKDSYEITDLELRNIQDLKNKIIKSKRKYQIDKIGLSLILNN